MLTFDLHLFTAIKIKLKASRKQDSVSDSVLKVQGKRGGRDAVVVEDLKVLVDIHGVLQEDLELLNRHLMNAVALFGVFGHGRVRWEADADIVRGVTVVVCAAVGGPHVLGDGHPVLVVATDHVSSGGHSGDDEGRASAEVVEPQPDALLVLTPRPDVELPDLWDHVGQGVGGGTVVWGGLVLVRVQVTSLIQNHVGVVVQHRLAVLKLHMQVAGGERQHVSIPIDLCQLRTRIREQFLICWETKQTPFLFASGTDLLSVPGYYKLSVKY